MQKTSINTCLKISALLRFFREAYFWNFDSSNRQSAFPFVPLYNFIHP